MPALFSLACEGFLPEKFAVVGVARSDMDNDSFRKKIKEGIEHFSRLKPDECSAWPAFVLLSARGVEQFAADEHAADFARAGTDLVQLRIAQQPPRRIVVQIAVTAQ